MIVLGGIVLRGNGRDGAAIACLQALQRAAELGTRKVILETDATTTMVVEAATSSDFDRCSASGLIWDLKELLICNFSSRDSNLVAHVNSFRGRSESGGTVSVLDSIPACIHDDLVAKDLASVAG